MATTESKPQSRGLFSFFFSKEPVETKHGIAEMPQPEQPQLFERVGWAQPGSPPKQCKARAVANSPSATLNSTPGRPTSSTLGHSGGSTPGGPSSLFDRYAESDLRPRKLPNPPTTTSKLRSEGVRITCYLNQETNRSAAQSVIVPASVSTLKQLLPLIQTQMKLEKKMVYARDLFFPDGAKFTTFAQVAEAAANDTPVIVGGGEPFDPSCVPLSLSLAHKHGGGRSAATMLRREATEKRKVAAHLKADQIRATGHGSSNTAVRTAMKETVEHNRQIAAHLRHEQMSHALARAAELEQQVKDLRARNERQREEQHATAKQVQSRREAQRSDIMLQSRSAATSRTYEMHQQQQEKEIAKAGVASEVRSRKKDGLNVSRQAQAEQVRNRSVARRMSSAARDVKRAELAELEQLAKKALHDRIHEAAKK